MFHTCNIGIYPTHVIHVQNYMCNIGAYSTHVLHVYNMCITNVSFKHVIHLYFYTCNTPKNTTHVLQVQHNWPCSQYVISRTPRLYTYIYPREAARTYIFHFPGRVVLPCRHCKGSCSCWISQHNTKKPQPVSAFVNKLCTSQCESPGPSTAGNIGDSDCFLTSHPEGYFNGVQTQRQF